MKRIEILKDRSASRVYRLTAAGPDGSHVVAKRCLRSGALTERAIYQRVLPGLTGRSLRYYGLAEESGTEFCWVFVEDAGGVPYSPAAAGHGRLAAEWLAGLHTCAWDVGRTLDLPDRGPDCYLSYLRTGRERIRVNLSNPALSDSERVTLVTVMEQCDAAEAVWQRIEDHCATLSPTLVHADLHTANIHVSPDGNALLPFDWESAGWGPPAIDLGLVGLDLGAYLSVAQAVWPDLELGLLERLAMAGRLFQLLAHIEWEARGLSSAWLHRPMKHMSYYQGEMAEALQMAARL